MLSLERQRVAPAPLLDRRRRRRRGVLPVLLVGLAVALLVVVLGAGLTDIGRGSRTYLRSVDRSYADQASVLAVRSNASAAELTTLLRQAPRLQRAALQGQLDALVASTSSVAREAVALAPPPPNQDAAPSFEKAMEDRAAATSMVRGALYGLLGMAPAPVVGAAPGSVSTRPSGGLTAAQAQSELGRAGSRLAASDRLYARARRALLTAAGHPLLPTSVWVRSPGRWSATGTARLVGAVTASSSLAAVHQVTILTNGVSLQPAPVPAPPGGGAGGAPAGSSVIPPTSRLVVAVVVHNGGNVGEDRVPVSATLQPATGGAPTTSSASVAIGPTASTAVELPALRVTPAHAYTLTVAVGAAAGQVDRSNTSISVPVWIAPAT